MKAYYSKTSSYLPGIRNQKKERFINLSIWLGLWCLNTTFNNISVILWRSVLLVEETGVPGENH